MSPSTKPYFIRALHEWCCDQGYSPHLVVAVDEHTQVPMEFVKHGEIVLNIGANAVRDLFISNEWISFSARFGGVSRDLSIPVARVASIFARETGDGLSFAVEESKPKAGLHLTSSAAEPEAATEVEKPQKQNSGDKKTKLTIVKK